MLALIPNRERNGARTAAEECIRGSSDVLLIGRDPIVRVYTDEVLERAGFQVHAMTPWEAGNMVNGDLPRFPLVIFNNTVCSREAAQIGRQFRRYYPAAKLLLILGADTTRGNLSIFDSILEGLGGPAALVREVRRLAGSAMWNGGQVCTYLPSA